MPDTTDDMTDYIIDYSTIEPPCDDAFCTNLHQACKDVFGNNNRDNLMWKLTCMPDVSVHIATAQERIVGFKIGHALSRTHYYSWLGGVHPDSRRQGIALRLSEHQHNCSDHGTSPPSKRIRPTPTPP